MYTLVLVIYFATTHVNGGTAVGTLAITGFKTEASCQAEAHRRTPNLKNSMEERIYDKKILPSVVKWECFHVGG